MGHGSGGWIGPWAKWGGPVVRDQRLPYKGHGPLFYIKKYLRYLSRGELLKNLISLLESYGFLSKFMFKNLPPNSTNRWTNSTNRWMDDGKGVKRKTKQYTSNYLSTALQVLMVFLPLFCSSGQHLPISPYSPIPNYSNLTSFQSPITLLEYHTNNSIERGNNSCA